MAPSRLPRREGAQARANFFNLDAHEGRRVVVERLFRVFVESRGEPGENDVFVDDVAEPLSAVLIVGFESEFAEHVVSDRPEGARVEFVDGARTRLESKVLAQKKSSNG